MTHHRTQHTNSQNAGNKSKWSSASFLGAITLNLNIIRLGRLTLSSKTHVSHTSFLYPIAKYCRAYFILYGVTSTLANIAISHLDFPEHFISSLLSTPLQTVTFYSERVEDFTHTMLHEPTQYQLFHMSAYMSIKC